MNDRHVTEDDLHAFVDQALDASRRAEVAAYLANHPDVAQRVESYRRQREDLRAALAPVANEPIPPELDIARMIDRRRRSRFVPIRLAAAAVVLLGMGVSGGWSLHELVRPAPRGIGGLAQEAADSYEVYGLDRARPVELGPADQSELVAWLSQRLNRPMAVPDLSASGYRFMGGRLVATPHGPAALFMYDDDRGKRLVLLMRPMEIDQTAPMAQHSRGLVTGFAWAVKGIGYSLVGPTSPEVLHPLAVQVRRQTEFDRVSHLRVFLEPSGRRTHRPASTVNGEDHT